MPNYDVSEAGRALLGCQTATETCEPSRPSSRLIQENYPQPPSAQPFPYNSWEVMTNIEKFEELRSQLKLFADTNERLGNMVYKLQGLLEQHRHSAGDGAVLVQYNRDRI